MFWKFLKLFRNFFEVPSRDSELKSFLKCFETLKKLSHNLAKNLDDLIKLSSLLLIDFLWTLV